MTVGGETLQAGTVLWGAGVRPSPLAAALGVPLDGAGRVIVGPDCAVPGHPELFVVGDMASFTPEGASAPLPGISPVAMQEARAAAQQHPATRSRACRASRSATSTRGSWRRSGARAPSPSSGRLRMSGLIAWLAWVFVHLWYLVGFRNRLSVFTNWIWAYVVSRHGARVITGRRPPTRRDARPVSRTTHQRRSSSRRVVVDAGRNREAVGPNVPQQLGDADGGVGEAGVGRRAGRA